MGQNLAVKRIYIRLGEWSNPALIEHAQDTKQPIFPPFQLVLLMEAV